MMNLEYFFTFLLSSFFFSSPILLVYICITEDSHISIYQLYVLSFDPLS